ncbi:hypothetical protein BKA65DRAFT_577999 [Rhexocercosporidium sp. MPI-PUGE-AT-0058]|nr:hypothetical protein BKA65DRAFT_577999 [Rhexocercosporidium sp. MPI-PUGE-AT-0058]
MQQDLPSPLGSRSQNKSHSSRMSIREGGHARDIKQGNTHAHTHTYTYTYTHTVAVNATHMLTNREKALHVLCMGKARSIMNFPVMGNGSETECPNASYPLRSLGHANQPTKPTRADFKLGKTRSRYGDTVPSGSERKGEPMSSSRNISLMINKQLASHGDPECDCFLPLSSRHLLGWEGVERCRAEHCMLSDDARNTGFGK